MKEKFTFHTKEIDGCVAIDTAPLFAYIATIEKPKSERNEYGKRFSVMVDGEYHDFKTVKKLDQFLQCVRAGATCEVFRNFDKCVSINFEFDL